MRKVLIPTVLLLLLLCSYAGPMVSPPLGMASPVKETGSASTDTDQDGFNDAQDMCLTSLQDWVTTNELVTNHTYFDFKMDEHNRGHIAFHDPSNDTLHYGLFDNGTFTTTLIDEGNNSGLFLSIVLDSMNQPTVVYSIGEYFSSISSSDRYAVGIADWNGTDWTKTKLEEYYTGQPTDLMSGYWNLRVTAHYGLNDELFVATITDQTRGGSPGWLNLISRNNTGDWNKVFTVNFAGSESWMYPLNSATSESKTFDVSTNSTGFPFVYFSGDVFYDSGASYTVSLDVHQPPVYRTLSQGGTVHKIADRTLSTIAFDSQDRMHIISAKKDPQQANRNTIVRSVSVLDTVNHSIMSTTIKYTGYQWSSSGTLATKSDDSTVSTHGTENEAGPIFYGGTLSANRTVTQFNAWNTIIALDAQERSHIAYDAGYETYDTGTQHGFSIASQTGLPVHTHSDSDGCDDVEDAFPTDSTQWFDGDGDGHGDNPNGTDADMFPTDATQWSDADGDGYGDNQSGHHPDRFPQDATQWNDTDGDGYGDNPLGHQADAFPNDPTQWSDVDGDGYGDNMNGNNPDHLPNNPSEHLDNDGDGTGDNADLDDDNDGINDGDDTWPFDPCVWRDTDGDGMADEVASDCTTTVNDDPDNDDDTMLDQNDFCPSGDTGWQSGAVTDYDLDGCQDSGEDTDDDNDGVEDARDLCPKGERAWSSNLILDADQDGCHDQLEDTDDDNDGISDTLDACPNTSTDLSVGSDGCPVDSDADGVPDHLDAFVNDENEWADTDGDGVGDNADDFPNDATYSTDTDSDGVPDELDAFPQDDTESDDTDQDGVGDNADAFPNDANETTDTDNDGVGDNADVFPNNANETSDTDGDGVGDNADAFPEDASETLDTDGDGVGDNADAFPEDATETTDTDGDGVGDNVDAFPEDATETTDTDGDGVGDNTDAYPLDATRSEARASVGPLVGVLVLAGLLAGILVMRMRKKDTGLGQQTPDIAENPSRIEPEEPVKAAPDITQDAEAAHVAPSSPVNEAASEDDGTDQTESETMPPLDHPATPSGDGYEWCKFNGNDWYRVEHSGEPWMQWE